MVKFVGDFVTQWFTASDEEYTTNMPHIVTHMREGDSCEDITAQRTADLAPTPNCVVWRARVGEDTLLEILACEQCVTLWHTEYSAEPTDPLIYTEDQLRRLQHDLVAVYNKDVARWATEGVDDTDAIVSRLVRANQRPPWLPDMDVFASDVLYFNHNLYEVIQTHRTQAGWTPDVAIALFKRFYEPSDDPWPWRQPLGSHDAYPYGARVLHNSVTWKNQIQDNVWEPGVYGWEREGGDTPGDIPEWVQPTGAGDAYMLGDRVLFGGNIYESLLNGNVWSPSAYPAGWLLLGPAV